MIIFTLIFVSIVCISVLSIFYAILPKNEKSKMNSKWLNKLWDELTTNNVKLSVVMLLIAILVFCLISFFSTNSLEEFIQGIHVELFGILFDVVVLVLLFNWINSHGEKKQRINRYQEEIEDFRHWNSEEGKFRIRGNIKRLNKEGVSKIDLTFVNISNGNIQNSQQLDFSGIKLDESRLLQSNLTNLRMPNSSFNGITDHYSKFIETGLLYAKFQNCHLQGTDFTKAFLHGADFSGSVLTANTNFSNANISHAKFNNVKIDSAEFHGAEVTKDFFDKVKNWKINGKNVFNDYELQSVPMGNNKFKYRLIKKNSMEHLGLNSKR